MLNHRRMYRQAIRGSRKINNHFDNKLAFKALEFLQAPTGNFEFSILDSEEILTQLQSKALGFCKQLDASFTIPILIQAFSDFYYFYHKEGGINGISLKKAIAFSWGIFDKNKHGTSKSISLVIKLIDLLKLIAYIEHLHYLQIINPQIATIKFNNYEIELDEQLQIAFAKNSPYSQNTAQHRTIKDSLSKLWNGQDYNYLKLKIAIQQKLNGQNAIHFEGTFFQNLVNAEFWLTLHARLLILEVCVQLRVKTKNNNNSSLLLFENTPLVVQSSLLGKEEMQNLIYKNFWRDDWYNSRIKNDFPSNMILERPFIRVGNSKTLFATSDNLIMDSINSYIENTVLKYRGMGGVDINPSVFKKYISTPFEEKIIDYLKLRGFTAGSVLDSGSWVTHPKHFQINNTNTNMPGEIDVLAVNEKLKIIIILECKVIKRANTKNALRNIIKKLDSKIDGEGFHSKLNKKCKWLIKSNFRTKYRFPILKAIVTDIPFPIDFDQDNPVLSFEHLKEEVNRIESNFVKKL